MSLTNIGLVEHAKMALKDKWGYVWGTYGNVLTETLFKQKLSQYPEGVGNYKGFIEEHWLNKRTADCVGLIKSFSWWQGDNPSYNAKTDVSADSMYAIAKEKGPINIMPEIPGLCLWKKGHIGIYIGNGQVIEARGTKYGVIQSPLTGSGSAGWTHWLKCPFIEYQEEVKKYMSWKEILGKVASNPAQWEKAIETAKKAAKADGNLGDLEILQFLPELIEKIYNSK